DVELRLEPGEAVALVGSNGAGKSTLLGCLMGDRLPDRGEIRVCGTDPFLDPAWSARCMGSVPEQPFLYGELSVGETLEFVAEARALPREAAASEGTRLLELLGLAGAESTLCRELSQGMGRKVAIIAALLHAPRVILLDEALNGLDLPSVQRLTAELERRRGDGASVLLSSHDLPFLARWCGRGLFLRPGGAWTMLGGAGWDGWRRAPSLDPI
ncbi:MAG: ABC transporter ATP-binding protein, partial [Gemmatimonadota bacterium]|nr:ABC transporter ATP-binding protein [Gemmatimonadota bacterium]